MCCHSEGHHGKGHRHHHTAGTCGCGEHFRFGACFATNEEKAAWLEQRRDELQEEIKALDEHIAKLKAS